MEAIQRFFDALSMKPIQILHRDKKRVEDAERKLKESGI